MSRSVALLALVALVGACTTTTIRQPGPAPAPTDAPQGPLPGDPDAPPSTGPDPERSVSGTFVEVALPPGGGGEAKFESTSVFAVAGDKAYAVSATGISRNRLHRWDGTTWREKDLFYTDGDGSSNLVFAVGSSVWAYGGSAMQESNDNGESYTAFEASYNSMWAASAKDVWGVAGGTPGGATVARTGGQAPALLEGTPLYKVYRPFVWGSGATDVYIGWDVDTDPDNPYRFVMGHLHHYDGSTFSDLAASLPAELKSAKRALKTMHGSSPKDVWAIGDERVVHFDGTTWSVVKDFSTNQTCDPVSVFATSKKNVWVGGTNGCLWHYDGVAFTLVPLPRPITVYSIHGADPENVWIATGAASVLKLVPSSK